MVEQINVRGHVPLGRISQKGDPPSPMKSGRGSAHAEPFDVARAMPVEAWGGVFGSLLARDSQQATRIQPTTKCWARPKTLKARATRTAQTEGDMGTFLSRETRFGHRRDPVTLRPKEEHLSSLQMIRAHDEYKAGAIKSAAWAAVVDGINCAPLGNGSVWLGGRSRRCDIACARGPRLWASACAPAGKGTDRVGKGEPNSVRAGGLSERSATRRAPARSAGRRNCRPAARAACSRGR